MHSTNVPSVPVGTTAPAAGSPPAPHAAPGSRTWAAGGGVAIDAWAASHRPEWNELRGLLDRGGRDGRRLNGSELRRCGTLYRSAAAHLAYARRSLPGGPVVHELDSLVLAARTVVYRNEPTSFSLWSFFARDYWRRIRERPWPVAVALLVLCGATLVAFAWARHEPARAVGLLPEQFRSLRGDSADQGTPSARSAVAASTILTNNIRVSFLAFIVGVTLIGPLYLLAYNGAVLGVVVGVLVARGDGEVAWTLVVAHGVLELSIVAVSAAAGLRVGLAMVRPGLRSRGDAVRRESAAAAEIVLGTIPWFVLAGLVEGFVTPTGRGAVFNGVVGLSLGALYWSLVVVRGRPRSERRGAFSSADDDALPTHGRGGLLVGGRIATAPTSADDPVDLDA